ncbi:MAG: M23 family metallopeptidase [Chloroflexi bacterium]|nr:M23 family metallopeptidase [Chloroflexota bacterium]
MRRSIRAIAVALVIAIILPAAALAHWPVANRYAYISQSYWSKHRAVDIATYKGTPIVPMRSGKVVFAGHKRNCGGYQVWVSHGNGLYSAYYHVKRRSINVWRGKYVKRQTTRLARVGESGCATGPHLHFEVWRGFPWASGSYRVNPWKYIDSGYWLPYRYR